MAGCHISQTLTILDLQGGWASAVLRGPGCAWLALAACLRQGGLRQGGGARVWREGGGS